jgi:hypothetical protein
MVSETAGVRKLRQGMSGIGKSGCIWVIYYFKKQDDEICLLTIYNKSEKAKIATHILRKIAEEIKNVQS